MRETGGCRHSLFPWTVGGAPPEPGAPVQVSSVYLVQEAGEEGVGHVVVEKRPLVHQDALDVLAEGRILTQQLHTRLSQNRLKRANDHMSSAPPSA